MMSAPARRASPGYMASFGFGVTGLVFLDVGVDAALRSRRGLDPSDAFNHSGTVALIAAFALTFLFRLIFWDRVTSGTQNLVRITIITIVAGLVLATIAGAIFVYGSPSGSMAQVFTAAALLSQVASVIWLVRYRRE